MVLQYIQRCISAGAHWDEVLVNCGLWDIRDRHGTLQTSLSDYAGNLHEVVRLLPHICHRFTWIRTTPVDDDRHNSIKSDYWRHNEDVIRYNAAADHVFADSGAPLIDLYSFCMAIGLQGAFLDHIHFTTEMRQLQAAFVTGQLVASLPCSSLATTRGI
jgi:hypothetical protein